MTDKQLDIPQNLTCHVSRTSTVIKCDWCDGIGTKLETELTNYHKGEYESFRRECTKCKGDGRLVKTEENAQLVNFYAKQSIVPYVDVVAAGDDPHEHTYSTAYYRPNNKNTYMESRHPDLAELSYEKYDNLLEQYKLIEILKK